MCEIDEKEILGRLRGGGGEKARVRGYPPLLGPPGPPPNFGRAPCTLPHRPNRRTHHPRAFASGMFREHDAGGAGAARSAPREIWGFAGGHAVGANRLSPVAPPAPQTAAAPAAAGAAAAGAPAPPRPSRSKSRLALLTYSNPAVDQVSLREIHDHVRKQAGDQIVGFPVPAAVDGDGDGGAAPPPAPVGPTNHVIGVISCMAPLPTNVLARHVHSFILWDEPHNMPDHLMWSFYVVKQQFVADPFIVSYKNRSMIETMILVESIIHVTADVSVRPWSPHNAHGGYAYVAVEQANVLKRDPRKFVQDAAANVVVIETWRRTLDEVFAQRGKSGKVDTFEVSAKVLEIARSDGVAKAMKYLADNNPDTFLRDGAKIEANLASVAAPARGIKRALENRVPWNDSDSYRSFQLWLDQYFIKGGDRRVMDHIMVPAGGEDLAPISLVKPRIQAFQIVGPSNSGKTSMILDHFPRDRLVVVSGTWSLTPFRENRERISNGEILAIFLDDVSIDQYFASGFKTLLSGQGGSLNAKMAAPFTLETNPPVIIATNEDIRKSKSLSPAMIDWLMDDQNLFTAVVKAPLMPDGRYYQTSHVGGRLVVKTANRDKVLGPLNAYFKNANDRDLIDDAGVGPAFPAPGVAHAAPIAAPAAPAPPAFAALSPPLPPPPALAAAGVAGFVPVDDDLGWCCTDHSSSRWDEAAARTLVARTYAPGTRGHILNMLIAHGFAADQVSSMACVQCYDVANTWMGLCITCWASSMLGEPWVDLEQWRAAVEEGHDPADSGSLVATYPCCDKRMCWFAPTYCRSCKCHV